MNIRIARIVLPLQVGFRIALCLFWVGATFRVQASEAADTVYQAFQQPSAEMRPFVRWWWNGSRVNATETVRQLEVMHAAGIGGVEINTIGMPEYLEHDPSVLRHPELEWLGEQWTAVVKTTVAAAQEHGMTADIIVGSGWPFGGRFLVLDEQSQRIRLAKLELNGPMEFSKSVETLWQESFNTGVNRSKNRDLVKPNALNLAFLRLVAPDTGRNGFAPGMDLLPQQADTEVIRLSVPDGRHTLYIGFHEIGYTHVKLGAPGADGPVVDHFDAAAVRHYLDVMSSKFEALSGGAMGEFFRATFVDSLELDHANWTPDFPQEFENRLGYSIWPYLPFVLDPDRPDHPPFPEFQDTVRRVRHDFVKTLLDLFEERFIRTYVDWAAEHGMQARIQGYGRETHPVHGSLLAPLPEGETWLWRDLDTDRYVWPQSTVVNKLVSSGARLSGKRLVSFEAMTNAVPVFRATLNDFKRAMDLSILDGLNHPILHGHNYFPQDAGFPGWVRFGSYVSEWNPFWQEFPQFSDYVARMGTVLRNSDTITQVAVLSPRAQEWAKHGMLYQPFPEVIDPWYQYAFPQAMQKVGLGVDVISQRILEGGSVKEGAFVYHDRAYPVLVLQDVEALSPEAAAKLAKFHRSGGKLVVIGEFPNRSPGFAQAAARDEAVRRAMALLDRASVLHLLSPAKDPQRIIPGPRGKFVEDDDLIAYAQQILAFAGPAAPVRMLNPSPYGSLVHHRFDDGSDVLVLANLHTEDALELRLELDLPGQPWRWDPHSGARWPLRVSDSGLLTLTLQPIETALVVLETDHEPSNGSVSAEPSTPPPPGEPVQWLGPWSLRLSPADGSPPFQRELEVLSDLSQHADPEISEFGGRIVYQNQFEAPSLPSGIPLWLDLGQLNGSAIVRLNGVQLGVHWYGRAVFDLSPALRPGCNVLEVEVSTVLANLAKARSLKKPPSERRWAWWYQPIPMGLEGPVRWGIRP